MQLELSDVLAVIALIFVILNYITSYFFHLTYCLFSLDNTPSA